MAQTNIVDYLTEKLTEATGIAFARDAWEEKAPENYGVVELGDMLEAQWADGKLIDAIYAVRVTLYVGGCEDDWIDRVNTLLESLEEQDILTADYTTAREFLMDIEKVCWTWNLRVYGPIITDMEAESNGTDGD